MQWAGGVLLLIALLSYPAVSWLQAREARRICNDFEIGSLAPDLEKLEANIWLTLKGPFGAAGPEGWQIVLCSTASLCNTSCSISYANGRVTGVNYVNR